MFSTISNVALNTVLFAHLSVGVFFLYSEYKFLSKIKNSKK
ncbi:MAG: hypothetical protein K0R47_2531 [Brevibacillus sp.]|nr:hypothetical protein [Brevibacillus sp.]